MGPEFGGKRQKKLDGSVRSAAYSFLEKLMKSDQTSGLHIEPIRGSADPKVRTGRVTDFYRAVLVKLDGTSADSVYVYLGTYPHDDAIKYAKTASVAVNPMNGVAELVEIAQPEPSVPRETSKPLSVPAPETQSAIVAAKSSGPIYPVLGSKGYGLADLTALGIAASFASRALAAQSEDELLALADEAPAQWQGLAVVSLAAGQGPDEVREELLAPLDSDSEQNANSPSVPEKQIDSDAAVISALQHPASRLDFAFIESDEDLRAAIEDNDFDRWRVFLHPEQRRYVLRNRNGAFRLSGGAGTGKSVVLVHRAKHLIKQDPQARVILTTFTRTLAESLDQSLQVLDPELAQAEELGKSGIYVVGIDQLVMRVLKGADFTTPESAGARAVTAILGNRSGGIRRVAQGNGPDKYWEDAINSIEELPDKLRSVSFVKAEYSLVVLPARITDRKGYVSVRRSGRGVRLSRSERMAVWRAIEKYRALTAIDSVTDWDEKAAVAARYLDERVREGVPRPATNVLVDEAQDLSPARLLFVRALSAVGPNDLFLAEDSHQRIYGNKIVMSRYGIEIRGRSRRLSLNYRTTAENLEFALRILERDNPLASTLDGHASEAEQIPFTDLDGDIANSHGYRSSRSGPTPQVLDCDSVSDELDKAAHLATHWTEAGVEPSSIGVLCSSKRAAEIIARGFMERGVSARYVGAETKARVPATARSRQPGATGPTWQKDAAPVFVMTMHRAKGMEFSRVILFNVHLDLMKQTDRLLAGVPEEDHAEFHQRNRSLEYVAATRARDELVVIRETQV